MTETEENIEANHAYNRGYSAVHTDQQKVIDRLTEVVRLAESAFRSQRFGHEMESLRAIEALKADGLLEDK